MSRALSPELCNKLAKVLPLLASDKEGEVMAAARAITRTLTAAGYDWHDLSSRLTLQEDEPEPAPAPRPAQGQPTPTGGKQAIAATTLDPMIEAIRRSGCYLSKNARGFLEGLEERGRLYGIVHFTERQWSWFLDLLQEASVEMDKMAMEDI